MAEKKQPKRRNRAPLNMRVSDEFRAKIEESAHASGRSLTREVEHLVGLGLESSRAGEAPHTEAMLQAFAAAISTVEKMLSKSWKDDPEARAAVHLAVDCLLRFTIGMDATERAKFNRKNQGLGAQVAQVWLASAHGVSQAEFARRVHGHPAGGHAGPEKSEAKEAPRNRGAGTILSDIDTIAEGMGDEPDPDRDAPPADDAESTPEPKPARKRSTRK